MKNITNEKIINNFRKVHGNKYDYSQIEYANAKTKIKIICPVHGIFEQTPDSHLGGHACAKCAKEKTKKSRTKAKEQFIKEAKEKHRDKYDYSKTNYLNSKTKVCIICPEHGEFWQTPNAHLRKQECPKCGEIVRKKKIEKQKLTTEQFIQKAKEAHGNKYDYSQSEYINAKTKVCIICPEHGVFEQTPDNHLKGQGCPKCGVKNKAKKRSLTTEQFVQKAKKVHGDKYNYSKVVYENNHTKVCIICPEHGEFWQTPMHHIAAVQSNSCPCCRESKGERKIRIWLEKHKIKAEKEFCFSNCLDKKPLPFDFYIPSKKTLIEYQGVQHFKEVSFFGGEKNLLEQKRRDKIKKNWAKESGYKLLTISYKDFNILEEILEENLL